MALRRVGLVILGTAFAVGVLAGPVGAHVRVEADPSSPGATDATLKIRAAGESDSAGTSKLEVVADPAIAADQVTLVSGPSGWTLNPGPNEGFVLTGPAVAKGAAAEFSVTVKKLPDAPQVVFKVLQTYSDGEVVRWIELAGPDGKEPGRPAAVVKLTPGEASSSSSEHAGSDHGGHTGEDADTDGHAHGSALARTGAADRALALAAGLFLALGGSGIALGARPRGAAGR